MDLKSLIKYFFIISSLIIINYFYYIVIKFVLYSLFCLGLFLIVSLETGLYKYINSPKIEFIAYYYFMLFNRSEYKNDKDN